LDETVKTGNLDNSVPSQSLTLTEELGMGAVARLSRRKKLEYPLKYGNKNLLPKFGRKSAELC